MKNLPLIILVSLLLFNCQPSSTPTSPTDGYDVVILNGRVMDPETKFDGIRNVGIKDGIIVSITEELIGGSETIDAKGLVVSPGFIDTQNHGHGIIWNAKIGLRDGVTSPMDLEYGNINVDQWYADREGKWPVNYGAAVSHELHRMRVLDSLDITEGTDSAGGLILRGTSYDSNGIPDWAETRCTLDQINEIMMGVDEDFRAGGLSAGSTMGYMGVGASTLEVFNFQKAAANYGRASSFHVRLLGNSKPPYEGTLGAWEQLVNGMALGAPVLFSHNNNFGWWEIEEHAQLFRDQGKNVWTEYYPYTCGSTTIGSEFLKPELIAGLGVGYEDMLNPITGENMNQAEYERIVKEDPSFLIILCFPIKEQWMNYWLEVPHMVVAGDAMPGQDIEGNFLTWEDPYEAYVGHPRTAGSHARTFRLAREAQVPLMQTIAQNSYWSALHLGDAGLEFMKVRGRMQEGMVADITIFDAENITDNATYKLGENGLPSTGIPYVLVNGVTVMKDSKVQDGLYPGQQIRYPIEEKGKWVNLEKEAFLEELLAPTFPEDALDHGIESKK